MIAIERELWAAREVTVMKFDLEEMLRDESTKAKLVEWAVAAALSYNLKEWQSREAALRGCNLVTTIWRQTIVRPVIDRLK